MASQEDDSPIFGAADEPTESSPAPTPVVASPEPSTSASTARVVLTAEEWRPQGDPMREFEHGWWDCHSGGTGPGRFINAYTMNPGQNYFFDASRLVTINQTVYAFELQAVLYTVGPDTAVFSDDRPRDAVFNRQGLPPTTWEVSASQRCVNVQWRVDLTGSAENLRTGSFSPPLYIDSAPVLLFVVSASLIVLSAQNETALTISPSSSASDFDSNASSTAGSSNSSSLPKVGVIVPAILIPALAIAAAVVAFVMWRKRQQRRMRLAPSAAFRQDHAATIARGVDGRGGGSPVPSDKNAYFPLDDKRPFNFSS